MKRSLTVSLILVGAAGCASNNVPCEMARDVYANATSCEADWSRHPLACEPFVDTEKVSFNTNGEPIGLRPRYYGPIYPKNKRPLSIQTASGVHSVSAKMDRTQNFPHSERETTGISADGQIMRGSFGRCTSASS